MEGEGGKYFVSEEGVVKKGREKVESRGLVF